MKQLLNRSFRTRLFAAFLVVSLIPLLLCSAMLLQIFRIRMTNSAEESAQEQLSHALQSMETVFDGFSLAISQLQGNAVLSNALTGDGGPVTQIYSELFTAIGEARTYARFDLYDLEGNWRYSTQQAPELKQLPTNWGVLYAASHGEDPIAYSACEDAADTRVPLLQGAALINNPAGEQVGYLLISMYHSNFRQMLEEKYGSHNDLMLLSRYWRPLYCAQPSLVVSLAPQLRQRLLSGQTLDGLSEDFLYSVACHQDSGLYLVLQRPQVFTQDTMRI